jgi:peptide chain release factor subunit 1
MAELDRDFLRRLTDWETDGVPVSSLYLDVDGRRYPRRQDVVVRAEQLCHQLQRQAEPLGRDVHCSVSKDAERMLGTVRDLERGPTKGLALFSASEAGRWEEVRVPRPLKDRAAVGERPYVMPLEALAQTYESFCTLLVDREKARFFLARMGRITEQTVVADDVPGRHDQGGWSQSRFQRHVEDHVTRHLKRTADLLLALFKHRGFDHLILAGPEEVVAEFERGLHDYLRRRVAARTTLPMIASAGEVLERSLAVEESLEAAREREVLARVVAESRAGREAVLGLQPVLDALSEGRVDTLVVPFGLVEPGWRCSSCGRLTLAEGPCTTCGGRLQRVPDVAESALEAALRQGSRVETLSMTPPEDGERQEIGALLRF